MKILILLLISCFAWGAEPTLPQLHVDTTFIAPTGTVHTPANSAALQTAITAAQRGDVIELTAGSIYSGNYKLPEHHRRGIRAHYDGKLSRITGQSSDAGGCEQHGTRADQQMLCRRFRRRSARRIGALAVSKS